MDAPTRPPVIDPRTRVPSDEPAPADVTPAPFAVERSNGRAARRRRSRASFDTLARVLTPTLVDAAPAPVRPALDLSGIPARGAVERTLRDVPRTRIAVVGP